MGLRKFTDFRILRGIKQGLCHGALAGALKSAAILCYRAVHMVRALILIIVGLIGWTSVFAVTLELHGETGLDAEELVQVLDQKLRSVNFFILQDTSDTSGLHPYRIQICERFLIR